jgi:hypothetical protein
MGAFRQYFQKEFRPTIKTLVDDYRNSKDPDFFRPFGTQIFVGRQGSGKTISAVEKVTRIKRRYPKAVLVSNLSFKQLRSVQVTDKEALRAQMRGFRPRLDYFQYFTGEQLATALTEINNGKYGVIFVVDEIHTYFNALESKNIPMYIFTEISQQRKQRKLIVGTSQLFMRTAKPLREQCDSVIFCKTKLNLITIQQIFDGMSLNLDENTGRPKGDRQKIGWFFHTRKLRSSFDTYQKVVSGSEQYENSQKFDLNVSSKKNKIAFKSG